MNPDNKIHSIKDFLIRFNAIIFIMVLTGVLIFCVLSLDSTLKNAISEPLDSNSFDTSQTQYDDYSKSQLNILRSSSSQSANQPLPDGRLNPFYE